MIVPRGTKSVRRVRTVKQVTQHRRPETQAQLVKREATERRLRHEGYWWVGDDKTL